MRAPLRNHALAVATVCFLVNLARRAAAEPGGYGEDADYVIIGGGTAGCVVAARICEALPDASVVVLERGAPRTPEEDLLVDALRFGLDTWVVPELTEAWQSEPNEALLPPGLPLEVLTGNTLGGSSAVNAAQWTKPPLATVAAWGFNGLTAESAAELYRKGEERLGVAIPPPELQATYFPQFSAAAAAAGLPPEDDPLSRTAISAGSWYNTFAGDARGVKMHAARGYLKPALEGPCAHNLRVIEGATVTRIVVAGGRAVGVEYALDGEAGGGQVVGARREVVSSAGPFMSPKLLQLSGIGPAEILEPLGVDAIVDLPVGRSAQGRPVVSQVAVYTGVPLASENNASIVDSPTAREQFLAGGGGPLGVGVVSSQSTGPSIHGYLNTLWALDAPAHGQPLLVTGCVLNARSRSTVTLNSTDPFAPPRVDLNALEDPLEVRDLMECLMTAAEITANLQEEFQFAPLPPVTEQLVRSTAANALHFVGGCRVGEVVDGACRVLGVEGLRVVDASVIPNITQGAGPMASVYMIAEFAAEKIIAES